MNDKRFSVALETLHTRTEHKKRPTTSKQCQWNRWLAAEYIGGLNEPVMFHDDSCMSQQFSEQFHKSKFLFAAYTSAEIVAFIVGTQHDRSQKANILHSILLHRSPLFFHLLHTHGWLNKYYFYIN